MKSLEKVDYKKFIVPVIVGLIIWLATNKANICQPATEIATGLSGVANQIIKPTITGTINFL